ncbi:MAG: type II toxin-antitoxin system VapC family toxin [Deltaproteobacteria bacterium]|nr:type II toxin-antitoxin system VapC family toxin [Deltaproteobacteria bacterium]
MTVFVDTSALYALIDKDDRHHQAALAELARLLEAQAPMLTTNYVLIEVLALVQRRIGVAAVRGLCDDLLPALGVEWISFEDHAAALAVLLAAGRRDLSFVDCTSFQIMRRLAIRDVLAFDPHFAEQGFGVRPVAGR